MDTAVFTAPYLLELHPPVVAPAPPPLCRARARLMLDWYSAPPGFEQDLDLAILREHERLCLACLRRNDWYRRYAPPAAPNVPAAEMEGA